MNVILSAFDVLLPTNDESWIVEDYGCDAMRESSRESRFAVSNGFLGVRCSRAINRSDRLVLPARTYVAGLFDSAGGDTPLSALVPAVDWLQLRITSDGSDPERTYELAPERLVLDLERGVVMTESRQASESLTDTVVRTLHLVSMSSRDIGLQIVEIRFEDAGRTISLDASIAPSSLGLIAEARGSNDAYWRTKSSGKRLGFGIASSLYVDGVETEPHAVGPSSRSWKWTCRAGQLVVFARIVTFARGETTGEIADLGIAMKLDKARALGWRGVLAAHEAAWQQRWHESDVRVVGDPAAQAALRFAIYHLNSAADPTDERVSIGARALTGDDYHGHVFWDTEIYLIPFYIFTWPEAARALLMYRFHTLDGARAKAARMGYRGALYAWESADTGDETAPQHVIGPDRAFVLILSGEQEHHISADVAYAVWQYWEATADETFLLAAGAEILFETARFWTSRCTLEADGLRHIRRVIGPDEYHEDVDDSAFTNVMARANIRRALETEVLLRERWPQRSVEILQRTGVTQSELDLWRLTEATMYTGFDAKSGLYEEFAGYFGLEDIDLTKYAGRSVPMDVVLGRERTQRSQVIKQADVVALLALLPEEFTGRAAAANYCYYEPRCDHGSSLSRAMHALVAARLGDRDTALRYFQETAAIDLSEAHAAIGGGVHIAAQGGIWLTAVFGFAGLSLRDDGVAFEPNVPSDWHELRFRVRWRGRKICVIVDNVRKELRIALEAGDAMTCSVRAQSHALAANAPLHVSYA